MRPSTVRGRSRCRGRLESWEYEKILMEENWSWVIHRFVSHAADFNCAIAPGLLPQGLLRLQFPEIFQYPLAAWLHPLPLFNCCSSENIGCLCQWKAYQCCPRLWSI